MRRLLSLIAVFTGLGCKQSKEDTPDSKPLDIPRSAAPLDSSGVRQPIVSPHPLRDYRKYVGTIDGKESITMDLTFKDLGHGLHGIGRYRYDQDGLEKSVHADFAATDRFEFQMWDTTGNHILETLTGSFTSLDSFAGTWTRFQPDSVQDPEHGTWKETRIPRERGAFKLTQTLAGITPVRFQLHRRENDSASKARIRENRIEFRYDSLPSRLELAILRVHSGRDSLDSVINPAIDRSMREFCLSIHEAAMPPETPIPHFVDSLFARDWAESEGRYFSTTYETEVVANANGVLSLRYSWSSYGGGAHGSDDHAYASFEAATGKRLELGDILVPDYQDRLGALAGEPTCEEDPEREYPCTIEGLVKKGFALRRNGIIFHGSIGSRERDVFIAYADLAPLIRPDGILEGFPGH